MRWHSSYSWLSLSWPPLSQITVYLKAKIWSLPKHENLTTDKKRAISPLFHNIFNISLTSRVQLHIYLLNVVFRIIFSSILQLWYVKIRISRSISERSLELEITRVNCIFNKSPHPGLSWMSTRHKIMRLLVRPLPGQQHSSVEIWSWTIFYSHSSLLLIEVSFLQKNVHSTG